jgi:hypothetical protein
MTYFWPEASIVRLEHSGFSKVLIARRRSYNPCLAKVSPGGESLGRDYGRPGCNMSSEGLNSSHGDSRHKTPLFEHLNRSIILAVHI